MTAFCIYGRGSTLGLAIVFCVVVQDAHAVKVFVSLGNSRVIHSEQDRLLLQCLWQYYGNRPLRQGLVNECIPDEPVVEGTVICCFIIQMEIAYAILLCRFTLKN